MNFCEEHHLSHYSSFPFLLLFEWIDLYGFFSVSSKERNV